MSLDPKTLTICTALDPNIETSTKRSGQGSNFGESFNKKFLWEYELFCKNTGKIIHVVTFYPYGWRVTTN